LGRLVWVAAIALIGGVLAYLFLMGGGEPKGDTPEPALSLPDVSLPEWLGGGEETMTVYKWQDDAGAWHFSDHAPEGRPSEAIQVKPQNVAPDKPAAEPEADTSLSGRIRSPLDRARAAGRTVESEADTLQQRLDAVEGP
jgi:hypothetical protein